MHLDYPLLVLQKDQVFVGERDSMFYYSEYFVFLVLNSKSKIGVYENVYSITIV